MSIGLTWTPPLASHLTHYAGGVEQAYQESPAVSPSKNVADALDPIICVHMEGPVQMDLLPLQENRVPSFPELYRLATKLDNMPLKDVRSDSEIRALQQVILSERAFYRVLRDNRPVWSEVVGLHPTSEVVEQRSAQNVFGDISDKFVKHAMACFPEVPLKARLSTGGYQGELKPTRTDYMLKQGVQYTVMDMTQSLFSSEPDVAYFYEAPPTGYCLLGFPHVCYYVLLEMVGRVFVTPATEPFVLGTRHHKAILDTLCLPEMGERRNLHRVLSGKLARCETLGVRSLYTSEPVTEPGSAQFWFYKILRWDAFPPDYFVELYRVYKQFAQLAASPDFPASLVAAQQLFGEYQVAIRMPFLARTKHPTTAEWENDANREWHVAIAGSIVYLAKHGLLYTDLRLSNILVHEGGDPTASAHLIDYDDVVALEAPAQDFSQFLTLLSAKAPKRDVVCWAKLMQHVETTFVA
jgi:hypothetical protein